MQKNYNQVINKQEQTLGPKRFKKLIQSVFTILTQYIVNQLRKPQIQLQKIIFHLNYYKRNCGKYINNFYLCCLLCFYINCNIKTHQYSPIKQKVQECRMLAKSLMRQKQYQKQSTVILRLCLIYDAYSNFKQGQYKKAKDLSSKIINIASLQLTNFIKMKKEPNEIVKIQLMLSSWIVSEIYKYLGKYELQAFLINKCIQYARKFLPNFEQFLDFLNIWDMNPVQMKVKLTRFQEKIRRVQLLEQEQAKKAVQKQQKLFKTISGNTKKNNFLQSTTTSTQKHSAFFNQSRNLKVINPIVGEIKLPPKIVHKKSSTFHIALKKGQTIPSQNNIFNDKTNKQKTLQKEQQKKSQQIQSQLKNLLIIKNKKKNYYFLKQQTLRYLNKQNNQYKKIIRTKKQQMQKINKQTQKINNQFDVKHLKEQINQFKDYQSQLIKQIHDQKWKYIEQLPATKKLNVYFKTFLQTKYYWHNKNVYSLVYGQVLNRSQMKIISTLRRKVHKKYKQSINQVIYNNILHQVQYQKQILQTNEFKFFINIYQAQKGVNGINQQIQIKQSQFQIIKYEPFYNYYSVYKGKLIKFQQHLSNLPFKSKYYVQKFIKIIKNYNYSKYGKKTHVKLEYLFNYDHNSQFRRTQNNYIPENGNNEYSNVEKSQDIHPNDQLKSSNQIGKLKAKSNKIVEQIKQNFSQSEQSEQSEQSQDHQKSNINSSQHNLQDFFKSAKTFNKIAQLQHSKLDNYKNKSFVLSAYYLLTIIQKRIKKDQNKRIKVDGTKNILKKSSNQLMQLQSGGNQSYQVNKKPNSEEYQQQLWYNITVQKISRNSFHNPNYNFLFSYDFQFKSKSIDYDQITNSAITKKFHQIWSQHLNQIQMIQRNIRNKLSFMKLNKLKKQNTVHTYINNGFLYTLVINNNSEKENIFYIENYKTKNKCYSKKQVSFKDLDFLPKVQIKIDQENSLQEKYKKIQKYHKIKNYVKKIFSKSKNMRFFTDFQTQFKKKLCFATIKNEFLFRGKMRQGRIMYMLTVKEFSKVPRPYTLRIFTLDSNSIISIDAQKIIFHNQKIFLESKLKTINQIIEIFSKNQFQIFSKMKVQPAKKISTRISILSNYSFQSGDANKDHIDEKSHINCGINNRRASKNSMFAKYRHKALIKYQQIEQIKKLMQQKKYEQQSNSSQNSGSSNSNSVISSVSSAQQQQGNQVQQSKQL